VNADNADRPLIPVLPLQSTVVYPQGVATVQVALAEHIGLLRAHPEPDAQIVLAFCETETDEEIRPEMLGRIGVMSRIIDRLKLPGDSYQVTFQGLRRVEIGEIVTDQPWFTARVSPVDERTLDPFRVNVFVQKAINLFERLVAISTGYSGIDQRLQRVLDLLRSELDRIKVAQEVEKRAKGDIEESRREYFLRQQMQDHPA
jgi:ATP-dependent Lon protease